MKLKIIPEPKFTAEVEITVPGQKELGTLPLTFKYRTHAEYQEWVEGFTIKTDGEKKEYRTKLDVFPEFVDGWDLDVEFTPENIKTFLDNYTNAYPEIMQAYSRLLFESRIKN